jgi:hypothetical protein
MFVNMLNHATLYSDIERICEARNVIAADDPEWTYKVVLVGHYCAIEVLDETGEHLGYL